MSNLYSLEINVGTVSQHDGVTSTVTASFATPDAADNYGMTWDGNNILTSCGAAVDKIYRYDNFSASVDSSFSTAGYEAYVSGILWYDGNLYSTGFTGNNLYKHAGFTNTITSTVSIAGILGGASATDLTVDTSGNFYLGALDFVGVADKIFKLSGFSATVSDSFTPSDTKQLGVLMVGSQLYSSGFGSGGDIYTHTGFSSTITSEFASPGNEPAALDHDDRYLGPNAPGRITATGGTITYTATKKIHTFTSSGTFTVSGSGDMQCLIVGGGGGGGSPYATAGGNCGGGGGAGGVRIEDRYVNPGSYTVTVGTGGAGGLSAGGVSGTSGGNSSVFTFVATGGGGGGKGGDPGVNGSNGGSGGGGGGGNDGSTRTGGTALAGQGYAGGVSSISRDGAGGGGASAVGGNDNGNGGTTQVGGNGVSSSISGSAVVYGGGGGGGRWNVSGNVSGGTGGGGTGGGNADGTAGTDGLGGGGGGSGQVNGGASYNAGDGGDGIVIIAYDLPGLPGIIGGGIIMA